MNTRNSATAVARTVSWPDPATVVLRGQDLHPLTDHSGLSRFGDDVWDTGPAGVRNQQIAPGAHFTSLPERFRRPVKTFALAVLDHDLPPALIIGSAGGDKASISTFHQWVRVIRLFADWMDTQQIAQISDVTHRGLERYRTHVMALSVSSTRKADYLQVVRVLWAYRDHLPDECRLPEGRPWGAASARRLAGDTQFSRYNKTPRIHPDTMEALLAWALRVLEDFGPDIREAFAEDRRLKDGTHLVPQYYKQHFSHRSVVKRLEHYLPGLREAGQPLPGQRRADGTIEIACGHLARILGCHASPVYRQAALVKAMAEEYGVAIAPDAPLGRITGLLHGVPWRDQPIGLTEIDHLVRMLRAASYITTCYLSGARPGEVLQLQRGCLHQDPSGQFTFAGKSVKGADARGVVPAERSWAIVGVVATAIRMLEALTDSPLLFPRSLKRRPCSRITNGKPVAYWTINSDIRAFIDWVNTTFTRADGQPPIPPDPTKPIHASRFRRSLAYFVVRRPGGLIAAALQYGHIHTKVTLGYSGDADTGWLDDLAIERLEMIVDQTHDDLQHLDDDEHISGPSAQEYRRRLLRIAPFAGRVTDKARNAERLLTSLDPGIHHGRGMTCVYRAETALCHLTRLQAGLDSEGPDETDCRSTCTNLAYTDRDINVIRQRLAVLETAATDPLSPRPLRDRICAQAAQLRSVITRHESRPGSDTEGAA